MGERPWAPWLIGAVVVLGAAGCGRAEPAAATSPPQDARGAMALLAQEGLCAGDLEEVEAGVSGAGAQTTVTCRTEAGQSIDAWDGTGPFTLVGDTSALRVVRGASWTVVCPSDLAGRVAEVTGGTPAPA